MIIFGSKSVLLKSEQAETVACQCCGKLGSVTLNVYGKHFHIFWLPIFPIGKMGLSHCQRCQNILRVKEMSAELQGEYRALAKEASPKIWQFSGLLLIVLLFGPTLVNLLMALLQR